ncbi:hypothetical protein NEDG_01682 [Nematocida displodere]|uniref:Mitochondrial import inner membrane translocase subunit n=1 Tax=Nematocida displodere TaxID=1805483 RepID=A0A177EGI0_9MICR|nr:hypothetical protein NEDG_01682 [Nematocida displodere]
MNSFMKWMRGNTEENDLRAFFEETTKDCFNECIRTVAHPLTPKEKHCITACTEKRVRQIQAIENSLEKTIREIKEARV